VVQTLIDSSTKYYFKKIQLNINFNFLPITGNEKPAKWTNQQAREWRLAGYRVSPMNAY
jgi:hypothetical protein